MTLREYVRNTQAELDRLETVVSALAKEVARQKAERQAAEKKLEDCVNALQAAISKLPLEQIQEIYDAEKSFQDGLNSILNYGQQHYGLNREVKRND